MITSRSIFRRAGERASEHAPLSLSLPRLFISTTACKIPGAKMKGEIQAEDSSAALKVLVDGPYVAFPQPG